MALPFTEGRAAVKPATWGFIDRTGAMAIAPQFDDTFGFAEGLAPAKVGDRWGFIDRTGKAVMAPRFDRVDEFSDGMALVHVWK